tara:strand:+ start:2881 stop:3291 length:411 start_codon:yes stop_codon:yes gene_type:complete
MSQAIKTAIYVKLTTDQSGGSLYDLVGGRIFELQGNDDADLPLLTYEVQSTPVSGLFDGEVYIKSQVLFTIFGHRRLGAEAIGTIEDKLYDLMKDAALAPTGYDRGVVVPLDRDRRSVFDEIISSESIYSVEATTV